MRIPQILLLAFSFTLAAATAVFAADGIPQPWQLNFQDPASPVMEAANALHMNLVYLITAITVFVLLLMLYVCVRFSRKNNPVPSKTTHNTTIEVVWTVIPVLILAVIAWPSYKLHKLMSDTPPEAGVTLKVTGYQWYWNYEYPQHEVAYDAYMKQEEDLLVDEPRLLAVDNPTVVPVDTDIRVLVTGGDVLHAWAMPAMGVKQDTVPGRLNETWFRATREGTFYGQCSELCGRLHGFMPIQLEVVSQETYDEWLELAKTDMEAASRMIAVLRGRIENTQEVAAVSVSSQLEE